MKSKIEIGNMGTEEINARVVTAGVAHRVTQRGNAKRYILDTDPDRTVFLCDHAVSSHGLVNVLAVPGFPQVSVLRFAQGF